MDIGAYGNFNRGDSGYLPPNQVWNRQLKQAGIQDDPSSYWSARNRNMANANQGYVPQKGPADWDAFRQNFGGGYAEESDYNNWRTGQQRERTLGDFVNRMSSDNPAAAEYTAKMGRDYDRYKGNLDAYLAAPTPQMDTSNRFEAGLSSNESRLNALLEDPEAIKQTAAYKFRLKQGEDAIQRQMGAKGLLNSGNRLMELTKYGQDMGSQEYDAQAGRLSNLVGMYSGNWIGDKNANTAKYSAESNAWNQRGGLLKDIYGQAQQGVTSAAKINSDDRVQWGNVWTKMAPKPKQEYTPVPGGIQWG